ncbi:MAG: hypothetical protein ACQERM_04300 [Methanobacteriota archaeon]
MPRPRDPTRFPTDTAAVVRSDERLTLLFLLLLSLAALTVFLYYTTLLLEGLPDPLPAGLNGS